MEGLLLYFIAGHRSTTTSGPTSYSSPCSTASPTTRKCIAARAARCPHGEASAVHPRHDRALKLHLGAGRRCVSDDTTRVRAGDGDLQQNESRRVARRVIYIRREHVGHGRDDSRQEQTAGGDFCSVARAQVQGTAQTSSRRVKFDYEGDASLRRRVQVRRRGGYFKTSGSSDLSGLRVGGADGWVWGAKRTCKSRRAQHCTGPGAPLKPVPPHSGQTVVDKSIGPRRSGGQRGLSSPSNRTATRPTRSGGVWCAAQIR